MAILEHRIYSLPGSGRNGIRRARLSSASAGAMIAAICMAALAGGCTSSGKDQHNDSLPEDALVAVGDSVLTGSEVRNRLPYGLSSEDSAAMARSIVESWTDRMLLTGIAETNAEDIEEIDRMVDDYRRRLLISRYQQRLRETNADGISEREVADYYRKHHLEMTLDAPAIQGLYVKIPSDATRLSDVRRWMMTATPDAIDDLETYGLAEVAEYSLFPDRWTDWASIAEKIPYDFGDPDAFTSRRRNFEISAGGFTYLLHISRSLPSGSEMPRETAETEIRRILSEGRGGENERTVMEGIRRQALANGTLRYAGYAPPTSNN